MRLSAEDLEGFKFDLMTQLVDKAFVSIKPKIPSETLRNALRPSVDTSDSKKLRAELFIPHFWAVMLHDGHRPFGPKFAEFLVYFRNNNDDPRKPNPERLADVRRLSKAEFQSGIAENRRLELLNPAGGPMQHMIVVKDPEGRPARVGRSRPQPFFAEGGLRFVEEAKDFIAKEFDAFVRRHLIHEKKTARFRLNF